MPARITPKQISVMTGSLIGAFSSIPTDAIRKIAGDSGTRRRCGTRCRSGRRLEDARVASL